MTLHDTTSLIGRYACACAHNTPTRENPSLSVMRHGWQNLGKLGERTFDYVWAFQVLYHMTDELLEACLDAVSSRMDESSQFYANVNTESPSGQWQEFPFQQRSIEFYREAVGRHRLAVEDLGQLRDHGYTRKVDGQYNHMLLITRAG